MEAREPSAEFQKFLDAALGGDHDALGSLFEKFRIILKHRVRKQMHRRLQGKLFDSDIVQDAFCSYDDIRLVVAHLERASIGGTDDLKRTNHQSI